jgi:hypothetical protein
VKFYESHCFFAVRKPIIGRWRQKHEPCGTELEIKIVTLHIEYLIKIKRTMPNRTFHKPVSAAYIMLVCSLSMLSMHFFWRHTGVNPLLGLALAVLAVIVIERMIHTTYTFTAEGCLVVERGRFSRRLHIRVDEIVSVKRMKRPFVRYILIEYGAGRQVAVQPDNELGFLDEIKKRQTNDE